MVTLVDWQILAAMNLTSDDGLKVEPFDLKLLGGHSLDVRLGDRLYDPATQKMTTMTELDNGYVMQPGDFLLAHLLEKVHIPATMVCRLEGKSSLGRQGLKVHQTAGFIDGGFFGDITLELSLVGSIPLRLVAGMRIGQLTFERTERPLRPYGHPDLGSKYQGQEGPTPAR